ncbi:hypothetical protein [Rodentibacter trehalosifermentans]|nr:hypothetical protein [Rodentibacter trehalosifermentans]
MSATFIIVTFLCLRQRIVAPKKSAVKTFSVLTALCNQEKIKEGLSLFG